MSDLILGVTLRDGRTSCISQRILPTRLPHPAGLRSTHANARRSFVGVREAKGGGRNQATGTPGPSGVIGRWTSHRDFRLECGEDGIRPSATSKASAIAAYMKQNPSLQIGIDTLTDPRNQDLHDRRVNAVRDARIQAGVPAAVTTAGINTSAAPSRGHGASCSAARAWPETPCEPGCLLDRATPAPDGRRSSWTRLE